MTRYRTVVEKQMIFRSDLFAGKVALVTGGGTGIGKVLVRELARHGASVVLASRKPEHIDPVAEEVARMGAQALAVPVDVRVPDEVDAMVRQAKERFGHIDFLVNNAGANFPCPAEEITPNGWNAIVGIALTGTFLCSRAVCHGMKEQGGGKIVNNAATYAWTGSPFFSHSGAAKAAVISLTKSLAVEWAPYGIRVNAVAPGPVDTEGARENLWPDPEFRNAIASKVPLGRMASAEDVVWPILYLLSDAADYVTGAVLPVDGGEWIASSFLR